MVVALWYRVARPQGCVSPQPVAVLVTGVMLSRNLSEQSPDAIAEEKCWPESFPGAPYEVRLDIGQLVYALCDHDVMIRREARTRFCAFADKNGWASLCILCWR